MKIDKQTWDKIKPSVIAISYAALLLLIVWHFEVVIKVINTILLLFSPLWIGIAFAYVLDQIMKKIESFMHKHSKPNSRFAKYIRPQAIILTILVLVIILTVIISIIIPQVSDSLKLLFNNLSNYAVSLVSNINKLLQFLHLDELNISFDIDSIKQYISQLGLNWENLASSISNWALGTGNSIISGAISVSTALGNTFTGFMISLYLLSNKEKYIRQSRKLIATIFGYDKSVKIFTFATNSNKIFSKFISGQLVEAIILGILCYIGMLIFNFPFAALISVFATVTALVPMFGAMFANIFGCLLILAVSGPISSLWFLVYFQCLQQIEGNIIYPKVVGSSVGLPGMWVLLSLVIFGSLFGLIGLLLAVPATACIYNLVSEIVNKILAKKKLKVTETTIEKN